MWELPFELLAVVLLTPVPIPLFPVGRAVGAARPTGLAGTTRGAAGARVKLELLVEAAGPAPDPSGTPPLDSRALYSLPT